MAPLNSDVICTYAGEFQMEVNSSALLAFVPLLIYSMVLGVTAYLLAKDKGRNVALWTTLGLIPIVNIFCIGYFIGSSSKKIEDKLDTIISRMGSGV